MYAKPPSYLIPYKRNPFDQEMKRAALKYLDQGETLHAELEEVTYFEKEFAEYCGRRHAIGLNSGTSALYLALVGCGVTKGDEVIIPPNSFVAVGHCVLSAGATPVFVDVEEDTFNIDTAKIREKITKETKAIIPVAHCGHPCDMDPIMEIAEERGLCVIEDDANAAGARYRGKRLPVGHAGVFCVGFKSLWAPGGGGFVVTDDKEIADAVLAHRDLGFPGVGATGPGRSDLSTCVGLNYKMTDIGASIGRVQLRHLDEYVESQRKNAHTYTEMLQGVPVATPIERDYAYHAFLRYTIRTPHRDTLLEYLQSEGIECSVLYSTANYLQPSYIELLKCKKGDFPITDKQKEQELSLPEPRPRTQWELEYVAKRIRDFFARQNRRLPEKHA